MTIKNGINNAVQTIKLYSEITDAYQELTDYGYNRDYQHIQISNTLNEPIEIRFRKDLSSAVSSTIYMPASFCRSLDDFWHKGLLEYKTYTATLPTEGVLIVLSW